MKNRQQQECVSCYFDISKAQAVLLSTFFFLFNILSANCQNTSYGQEALQKNTTGSENTGLGYFSLYKNNTGSSNTATGSLSLYSNTSGNANTALGYHSLYNNIYSGHNNTSTGYQALYANTTADDNTGNGVNALLMNAIGSGNTALGVSALRESTTGILNTAVGVSALRNNTSGSFNTAFGYQALYENKLGSYNTALGYKADVESEELSNATAIGANAKILESNAIQLGDKTVTNIFAGAGSNAQFITGSIQVKGGSPALGKVLLSDASGNASWGTPSLWIAFGPNIRYTAGAVRIGSNLKPAGYKLSVGGKLIAEALDVTLKANWPDYVFESGYKLSSLSQLEKEIMATKHLPDMPSAWEMESNGQNVGDVNVILLKKIEELMLHLIELEKRVLSQQNELKSLINEK